MTTEELAAELAGLFSLTAVALSRAAAVYGELRRRGAEVVVRSPVFRDLLPKVAAGELAAEAVAAFADAPGLLKAVGRLTLHEQQRLAAGEPVEVVTAVGEPPRPMTARQLYPDFVRSVLAGGSVLSPAAQRKMLARPPRRRAPGPAPRAAASPSIKDEDDELPRRATEEQVERLAELLDAEMRKDGGRPTAKWIAEKVAMLGWLPCRTGKNF